MSGMDVVAAIKTASTWAQQVALRWEIPRGVKQAASGQAYALSRAEDAIAELIAAAKTARMLADQINRNDDDAINLSCDILDVLDPALAACKGLTQ